MSIHTYLTASLKTIEYARSRVLYIAKITYRSSTDPVLKMIELTDLPRYIGLPRSHIFILRLKYHMINKLSSIR